MRKTIKRLAIFTTVAVMSASALSLAACGSAFTPLGNIPEGEIESNGGFVVKKGDYYYFINGVESYTSDNTYGNVVKGALMRVSESNLSKGEGAEVVVPSLMVAGDYSAGLFIYGDRVYYATPNNVKNLSGTVENEYLDFKSAKLDGSDVRNYFRVADNSTVYRYVEEKDTVYLVYEDDNDLYSYNTASAKDTLLAESVGGYVLNTGDKTDPYIYYTMSVSLGLDTESPQTLGYNQIYRVSASVTEAPYEYEWDETYLEEHDGKAPYVNLGEIVLDGVSTLEANEVPTQFTHDITDTVKPLSPEGYTYTLQTYGNGGIYFTRKEGSTDGKLYYLSADKLGAGWNSVSGNTAENFAVVAQDTTNASSSALYYIENGEHRYLYVKDNCIYRADVKNGVSETVRIARNVSGATLMYLQNEGEYGYVYFNRSNGNGVSVERAVYNGKADDYSNLLVNEEYKPVKLLDLQHASGWYNYEIVNGHLFFADAEQIGSTAYNYVSAVNLTKDGKLMKNSEIEALNEKYEEITDYIADLSDDESELSNLVKCFFYAGSAAEGYLDENLKDAKDAGKKDNYLYDEDVVKAFRAFAAGTSDDAKKFADGDKTYSVRSYFITRLGTVSEEDEETYETYWKNFLEHYTAPETDEGLAWWVWALIGAGCGVVVIGAALAVFFALRAKKRKTAMPAEEKMAVDTTDDRDVDVYASDEAQTVSPELSDAPEEEEAPVVPEASDEENND